MRRQTPLAQLVYQHIFPQPSPHDPTNFSTHLARNLIPEVRIEVATFYGDLNSVEARYPGLDYCHPPHRMRLGRFKHHKRLFEAFEALGLTRLEVDQLCCWEGTKWARELYERDEGIKVSDTTGDEIGPWVEQNLREPNKRQKVVRQTNDVIEDVANHWRTRQHHASRAAQQHQRERRHLLQGQQQGQNDQPESGALADTSSHRSPWDDFEQFRQQTDDQARNAERTARADSSRASTASESSSSTISSSDSPSAAISRSGAGDDAPNVSSFEQHYRALLSRRQDRQREQTELRPHAPPAAVVSDFLPPEIEQWLKEQSERGNIHAAAALRTLLDPNRRAGAAYVFLLGGQSGAATAAAATSSGPPALERAAA